MSAVEKIIQEEFKVIGRNKYNKLKSYDFDNMCAEEMVLFRQTHKISVAEAIKQIEKYEAKHLKNKKPSEQTISYFKNLLAPVKKQPEKMTKEWLYKRFIRCFRKNEGVYFEANEDTIENLKPLIYYFIGDFKNFKECQNLSDLSKPHMRKGLLLIGGFGNGKTSIMRALESALKESNIAFKGFTTNEVVKIYEAASTPIEKKEFDRMMLNGVRYFDDVLTEREASNYGKSNLMKDILEERYNKNKRTYISCNHKDGNTNLNESLEQFGEKYGSRVYDRLFAMFNIIEFKGKSFRK